MEKLLLVLWKIFIQSSESILTYLFSVNGNKKIPFKLKFDVDFIATLLSK